MGAPVTRFGFTLTIDLHGLTAAEGKRELLSLLKACPKDIKEIDVVHGYSQGQALQGMVRKELKHPRVARKILGMNPGQTTLLLKEPAK